MPKVSVIERNKKRIAMVEKYRERRAALKAKIRDQSLSDQERHAARLRLQALPRDSSPVRLRNRCALTGRGNGVYRRFGLGRNKLREAAMRGDIPGLVKASW